MTSEHDTGSGEPERHEHFPATGPLELELSVAAGRIELHLDEPTGDSEDPSGVTVRVRHDPSADASWADGVHTLLDWLGDSVGEPSSRPHGETTTEALAATHIECLDGRLLVNGPRTMRSRRVPLAVTVHAPAGSRLRARTTSAGVTTTGHAGGVDVVTGSGSVSIPRTNGTSSVRTGSGEVDIASVTGTLNLRAGSGTTRITELGGNADLVVGTATVRVGTLDGELFVRAGSGNLVLAEARSGSVQLIGGSGDIRIGIGYGALAGIDISSGAGRARSELEVREAPPEEHVALTVHARSGTGDVTLTSSASVS